MNCNGNGSTGKSLAREIFQILCTLYLIYVLKTMEALEKRVRDRITEAKDRARPGTIGKVIRFVTEGTLFSSLLFDTRAEK